MSAAVVEFVVTRGKAEVARRVVRVDDGAVGDVVDGPADHADVVLTVAERDAAAIRDGALDPSVAFMRGTMKMAGDFGVLLRVLPVLSRAPLALV